MKNWHQFVFYDNKLFNCLLWLVDALHKSKIHVENPFSIRIFAVIVNFFFSGVDLSDNLTAGVSFNGASSDVWGETSRQILWRRYAKE